MKEDSKKNRDKGSRRGQKNREISVGLPRAMLYYRYEVLWTVFFEALGVRTLVSEPTNKEIVKSGTGTAIDESCLSEKIYLGHIRSLIGQCDYILVPRISNFGRNRVMCTRFESAYDLAVNVFRSSSQKFISYNIDVNKGLTEEKAFLALGAELGFSKKQVEEAYKKARKAKQEDDRQKLKEAQSLYKKDGLKVMIAGHSYIVEDDYFGKPVLEHLKSMGVTPIRADLVDRKEALKQSQKVSPTLKWQLSREIVGSIQMHRDKIDGVILLSAFPCGSDAMVNEIVTRKMQELPMLNLILDAQSGTAGIETRLESFIDILKLKKGML